MAVVDILSSALTNRDANTKNGPGLEKGMLREAIGYVTTNSDDSIGSTYRFCQIPSNARVSQILLYSDGGGAAGAGDIGIYQTTDNGSAVVDADHFSSAVVVSSALAGSDVTHESAVFDIDDMEKPLWEALGLSEDSQRLYDVVMTLTAAITTAATKIGAKVRYAI